MEKINKVVDDCKLYIHDLMDLLDKKYFVLIFTIFILTIKRQKR